MVERLALRHGSRLPAEVDASYRQRSLRPQVLTVPASLAPQLDAFVRDKRVVICQITANQHLKRIREL